MLSIFATTDTIEKVRAIIARPARLGELVTVADADQQPAFTSGWHLRVEAQQILFPLDWQNALPPYLLPDALPFDEAHLLGAVYGKLGNLAMAAQHLGDGHPLYQAFAAAYALQYDGLTPSDAPTADASPYRVAHNRAIATHYGSAVADTALSELDTLYREAAQQAPDADRQAFTTRHWATLWLDAGQPAQAAALLTACPEGSAVARTVLRTLLAQAWHEQLDLSPDPADVARLKALLNELVTELTHHRQDLEVGRLLLVAADVAHKEKSYSEALGYLTRALQHLEREDVAELVGEAQYRKGQLLSAWAKESAPQFYRAALQAYQEALKVFTKEAAPDTFAEIHHQLGMVYAEMPDEHKKRQIWAALSARSFQEAMAYYARAAHPYAYAAIANNYANAMTKFPTGLREDNYGRAIALYTEALEIRGGDLPVERALTLLNYLEAQWFWAQDETHADLSQKMARWEDMQRKALEVKSLVTDPTLHAEADGHLARLQVLREVLTEE